MLEKIGGMDTEIIGITTCLGTAKAAVDQAEDALAEQVALTPEQISRIEKYWARQGYGSDVWKLIHSYEVLRAKLALAENDVRVLMEKTS